MRVTKPRRVRIPGKAVHSAEAFYDEISRVFKFPPHFGRNLDALWDALTADVEGPIDFIWADSEESRKSMGPDFEKISGLLKEVERERGDFRVFFK
ncbi:MAG TPA: barstar family protein [Thermodesulfobacteriota bacterium]|nr:barstar family protein [Thermodesulfobacteriota bacterium]